MDILWNSVFFILALGILVTFHEFGHFWVARKLGVKVLTFSVGFGKPILQKMGKDGVQYVLAAIPLGGYVKMLDEREDPEQEISELDKPRAFNRKSVWRRMAIVLAGPVANFILAIGLYWLMFVVSIDGVNTEVGEVPNPSIAYQAGLRQGDKIVSVDGEDVILMNDLAQALAKRIGEHGKILVTIQPHDRQSTRSLNFDISHWKVDDEKPELLHSLGIFHQLETLGVVIGEVTAGSPADQVGIKAGDKIKSVDGMTVNSWREMVPLISAKPNKTVLLEVERSGELIPISVVIGSANEKGKTIGRIGIGQHAIEQKIVDQYLINRNAGVFEAFGLAINETKKMVSLTASVFVKLFRGEVSTKSLSGPLSIAKGAGDSASYGISHFVRFLAMISVNLGFINLLPVPMLDGGHLLYFVIEAIKGRPLSQKVQEFGLQVGMMLVFALMAIVIFNDVLRF